MLLKFNTESEWLEARKSDITSTEIAALFGLHPYKSRLALYYEKTGELESDFEDNDLTKWGRRFQIPVAMGICEDNGWEGFDLTGYYFRDEKCKTGASLDVKAVCPKRGTGVMEVKIAESFSEDMGWTKTSAPTHYEFQLQSQMNEAAKNGTPFDWGVIATLGRRQYTRLYMREYDPELGAIMDNEAEVFWESVRTRTPPKPDYTVDLKLIERFIKNIRSGDIINLSNDNRACTLVDEYYILREEKRNLQRQADKIGESMEAIQAELLEKIGRNEKAKIGEFIINTKEIIVEDKVVYGHKRRSFTVSKPKTK